MDLFILTQTQLGRVHKFIPAFVECHSKNPKNLTITQRSFYKAALSISSLSISMTFVIQEDSGSPDADNFSYMYQMSVPNVASVTAV